jgi:hypothetical protein
LRTQIQKWTIRRRRFAGERRKSPLLSSFVQIGVETCKQFSKTLNANDSDLYILPVAPSEQSRSPQLPKNYSDLTDVFSEDESTELPARGPHDLAVELEPGTKPPFSPLYNLSTIEMAALRKYITKYLARGWIRRSRSPAGAPILSQEEGWLTPALCGLSWPKLAHYQEQTPVTSHHRIPKPIVDWISVMRTIVSESGREMSGRRRSGLDIGTLSIL